MSESLAPVGILREEPALPQSVSAHPSAASACPITSTAGLGMGGTPASSCMADHLNMVRSPSLPHSLQQYK